MYKDIFTQLGLTANESIVYEFLLKNGASSAGEIIKKNPLKRGVIYNTLADLVKKELISEGKRKKIACFIPNHPAKLLEYLDREKGQLTKAENTLKANISALVSNFNLVSNKPGVRYFEGVAGIKKVLEDTLTSHEIIYSYTDIEAMVKYIEKINKNYVKKRQGLGIKKRGIIVDSPFARKYLKDYYRDITESRFIDPRLFPFNSIMQIYNNKVAYITLSAKKKIALIIEDKNIYQMHKSLFQDTWSRAKPLE